MAGFEIAGPKNNLPFFAELLDNAEFVSGHYDTAIVSRMRMTARADEPSAPEGAPQADSYPASVSLREVGPRDGLQNEDPVPTEAKVRLLDALSGTGVRRIEAVSFVHPKAIPQMADADEVWARRGTNPRRALLGPGTQLARRPARARRRLPELEVVVSASDTHNRRNVNRSTGGVARRHRRRSSTLVHDGRRRRRGHHFDQLRLPVRGRHRTRPGGVALSTGCVADGADRVAFGDTTGMATPAPRARPARRGPGQPPGVAVLLHFHNTRGTALANILTALRLRHHRVRRERRRPRRMPVRARRDR